LDPVMKKFGTAPVFFTAISTILGAIMFLRFGYAVANVGFFGVLLIILIGHLVTIPTAMAIAEIATNQKVQGGGMYYIISRSFGLIIGSTIGISLFLSQAISVAFYMIAFAEAFDPLLVWINDHYGFMVHDRRWISIPATFILTVLILKKGANMGVKVLYVVIGTLFVSILFFFLGNTGFTSDVSFNLLNRTVASPDTFFLVFAICFPAFTGMAAGVGLSGDLRDPQKSIPLGTLGATIAGMLIYAMVAYKLAISASPGDLAGDQLIMSRIAIWGPIIPIGLACATLSSALGSYLVAPRTLQAIGGDAVLPWTRLNAWLAKGSGPMNEPINSSLVTACIAVTFIWLGDINFVAQIISVFFMMTYGAICLISFIEHFAADPSYRPTFRSRWFISLAGAIMCVWLMFEMSPLYFVLSILMIFSLYTFLSYYNKNRGGLSNMIRGAIFQISRQVQVFVQKTQTQNADSWRPSIVCLSHASFERLNAFNMIKWISHRYGFGTYIHLIEGYLSRNTRKESEQTLQRLIRLANISDSNVYVDTIVSPSYTTAIAQIVQLPGISGKENNIIFLEFARNSPEELDRIIENYQLIGSVGFDVCILSSSSRGYGYKQEIHIWLNSGDYENSSLMILLGYIIIGHPDWKGASIHIFSIFPKDNLDTEEENLRRLIYSGRLPISARNIEMIPQDSGVDRRVLIREKSQDADLIITGFRGEAVKKMKRDLFSGYDGVGNVLFVNTKKEIDILPAEDETTVEYGEGQPDLTDNNTGPAEINAKPSQDQVK
jgi:solute carrier family 12 (sodium/potassium/chloride transporter), member 2